LQLPNIKTIIFFILFFLFSSIVFFFLIISFYDQNSFLNIIENNIITYVNNNKVKISPRNIKYNIININKKISSNDFKYLLYFIKEANPDNIFLDINFDRLKDNDEIIEIEKYLASNKKIFGILHLSNLKGIKFSKKAIDKELFTNTINIKSKYPFFYAYCLGKIRIKNIFSINPEKIGFINNNFSLFNNNNVDLLFKINNKYLISAPFLFFLRENGINLNQLKFEYTKINYFNRNFNYDQKGKASFIHRNIKRFDLIKDVNNFDEFEIALNSRKKIIDNLKLINLFNSKSTGFELYKEESKIIDEVYKIQDIDNSRQNELLTQAKNEALKWKAFKNVNLDKINKDYIFITQDDDYKWISDFFYQKNLFRYGLFLKKVPIILIVFFLLSLFLALILLNYYAKNNFFQFFIIFLLSTISLISYFFLRIYLFWDFPFIITFLVIIYSYMSSIIIKNFNNKAWVKEVKSIYKGSISSQFAKKIAFFWKYNNWNLDSKQYLCTFLFIDKSIMLTRDISEGDVEIIGAKNSEIESTIKKHNGIRNTFTPTEILCYFGNPPIIKNHAKIAIETVFEINKMVFNINNETVKLRQALHSKEEWFKFVKKGNQKYYTYFGNSINILAAMIHYAKLFNVTLIISETVFKLSKFKLPVRMLDRVKIEGIKGSLRLFELIPYEEYNQNKEFYNFFHAGLKLYENKKWKDAGAYFRQCLKINKEDNPSKIYLDRCKKLIMNSEDNWNPTYLIS
jgi:hypothetical protein